MGCIWYFVYINFPILHILGLLGFFGEEAGEAAWFTLLVEGFVAIVVITGYLIYLLIAGIANAF